MTPEQTEEARAAIARVAMDAIVAWADGQPDQQVRFLAEIIRGEIEQRYDPGGAFERRMKQITGQRQE